MLRIKSIAYYPSKRGELTKRSFSNNKPLFFILYLKNIFCIIIIICKLQFKITMEKGNDIKIFEDKKGRTI